MYIMYTSKFSKMYLKLQCAGGNCWRISITLTVGHGDPHTRDSNAMET